MEAVVAKIITIAILLVTTLLLGVIPYFIIKRRGTAHQSTFRDQLLSYLNCFAGGVFLGTCLLHLFVEGMKDLEGVLKEEYNVHGYPVFELLVGGGFFLIAIVEQLATICISSVSAPSSPVHPKRYERSAGVSEKSPLIGAQGDTCRKNSGGVYPAEACENCDDRERQFTESQGSELERSISHTTSVEFVPQASGLRAVLLLMAMSFHTVFDGLAVGLQKESDEVWEVFGAITVHKSLVAFCLGFQLFRSFQPNLRKAFGCLVLFSLMSPIGISVGIALTSSSFDPTAQDMASGVLQGIACGTFLYVTCFEILKDEIAHKGNIKKIAMAVAGFLVMSGVKALDKD